MDGSNYEFYVNGDFSEYAGKWIVISGRRVVGSGSTKQIKLILKELRDSSKEVPLVAKIPETMPQII